MSDERNKAWLKGVNRAYVYGNRVAPPLTRRDRHSIAVEQWAKTDEENPEEMNTGDELYTPIRFSR